MPERLLRVTTPRYVAGAVWVKTGGKWVCTEAAPILSWMRRKSAEEVRATIERYGWEFEWIKTESTAASAAPQCVGVGSSARP